MAGIINATDVLIYIRNSHSDNMILACMQNAVVNIENEFLDTTTKGDGKIGGALQSGYNVNMQGSGVMDITADSAGSRLSGNHLLKSTLEGSECLITYKAGVSNYIEFSANAVIQSLSFQSNIGSLLKFSATFRFTSEILRTASFDLTNYYLVDAQIFRRVSTTTESGFTDITFINNHSLILAVNGVERTVIPYSGIGPLIGALEVGWKYTTGEFSFGTDLVNRDVVTIIYY